MTTPEARPTTYSKGNKVEYTGKVEELYGGTFYQVRVLEGPEKGKLRDIVKPPPSVDKVPEASKIMTGQTIKIDYITYNVIKSRAPEHMGADGHPRTAEAMRKIDTIRASTFGHGMGNIRHARNWAAHLCAELHLLGYPGAQIQQADWHQVGSGLFPSTYCNYGVYSDAPQDAVDEAQEAHTFTSDAPLTERLKAWALTEWYGQNWVQASRLFACLYTLDESIDWHNYVWAARQMFGKTAQHAFAHELAQTAKETGKACGPFYFGTKWPSPKKA